MKKILLIATAFLAFSFSNPVHSQDRNFDKGAFLVNGGISFGGYGYSAYTGYNRVGLFPALTASADFGIHEYVGVGAFFGFQSRTYEYTSGYWQGFNYTQYTVENRFSETKFGVQGTFHYIPLLNKIPNFEIDYQTFDLYVTVLSGVELETEKLKSDYSGFNDRVERGVYPVFGTIVGGRYMFNRTFGVYAETGYGYFGYFNIGFTAKLN